MCCCVLRVATICPTKASYIILLSAVICCHVLQEIDLQVYLDGSDPLADTVKYIDQGWSTNMGYFDGAENWKYLELRWGKRNPVGRKSEFKLVVYGDAK